MIPELAVVCGNRHKGRIDGQLRRAQRPIRYGGRPTRVRLAGFAESRVPGGVAVGEPRVDCDAVDAGVLLEPDGDAGVWSCGW